MHTTGPDYAQTTAERDWHLYDMPAKYGADLGSWAVERADGDRLMVSTEVAGPRAVEAMHAFTAANPLVLLNPDDRAPMVSYAVPGRVECVWRTRGVWVSLWAAEPAQHPICPAPASPAPERAATPFRRLRWFIAGAA